MTQHERQSQVDAYLELLGRECRERERLLHARLSLSDCTVTSSGRGAGAITAGSGFSVSSKGKIKKKNPKPLKQNLHQQPNPLSFLAPNCRAPASLLPAAPKPAGAGGGPVLAEQERCPPPSAPHGPRYSSLAVCSDTQTHKHMLKAGMVALYLS